jgi:hypothetical protein
MRNPANKQTKIAIEPWQYLSTSTTATTTSTSCSQDTLPALLPQEQPPVRYSAFLLSSKYLKCIKTLPGYCTKQSWQHYGCTVREICRCNKSDCDQETPETLRDTELCRKLMNASDSNLGFLKAFYGF